MMCRYKAALIDLSGTIHVGSAAIPGAIQAIQKLFSSKLQVLFLTNTSKISSSSLLQQLREISFDESILPEYVNGRPSIMTSVSATRQYVVQNNLRPFCLLEEDLIQHDFKGVPMTDPNCVLVGLAPSRLNYETLNEAYRLLIQLNSNINSNINTTNESSKELHNLIAIHRATHYRDSDCNLSLGPGGFISLLEQTTNSTAHIIGKPSSEFYQMALSSLGVDKKDAIMIGDDIVGDIKGAFDAGLGAAILVKTGKYVVGDEKGEKTNGVVPTFTMNSIVEAVDYILQTSS